MCGLFYVKQIAFSTIDGNVEFAHSQSVQLYFDVKSVNSVFVSDKIIDNFVGHKNWIDTFDVRIQLYWECTNSTLPIVLEFA